MRRAALLAAILLATSLPAGHAAPNGISAAGNRFLPGDITVTQGDSLTFANADVQPHNVVSDATTKSGPLFRSNVATTGQSADVSGVGALKPGTYPFYCSLHPAMRGTLTVTARTSTTYVTSPAGNAATPTAIAIRNGALYVTSYGAGVVAQLSILPGGALGPGTPYATGFDSPLGLVFAPDGTLYVSDSHDSGAHRVGRVWSVKADGTKSVVIDNLPNGRHNTNNLAILNNRLYVTNGSSTDDGVSGGDPEQPLSGTLLSYALPVTARSKPTVESRGLRNVFDVAFRPGTTEAWFPTNGPDAMAPLGEDLLHKVDVRKGTADYGFPACVYKSDGKSHPVGPVQSAAVKTPCHPTAKPVLALGLHVSADGVAFGPGGLWGNDLYLAEYGANGTGGQGHKVIRIPIVNGTPQAPQDVIAGASPLDLTFGPDGLYVADFASGVITLVKAV